MSKRCSAITCFNCQMTNKAVQYFCFPKHADFAHKWSQLSGRPDLYDKPLHNIVKYYLCSAHFADNCFADPPHNTKLVRSLRPFSVPLPTIFAPEADYGPLITANTGGRNTAGTPAVTNRTNEPPAAIAVDDATDYSIDNDVAADYAINTDAGSATHLHIDDSPEAFRLANLMVRRDGGDIEHDESSYLNTLDDIEAVITDDVNYHRPFEDDSTVGGIIDCVDHDQDAGNADNVLFIDDRRPDIDVSQPMETVATSPFGVVEESPATSVDIAYADLLRQTCRLCAHVFDEDEQLMEIFGDNGHQRLEADLDMLLPNMIFEHDGRPQQICAACCTKADRCARVIRELHAVQDTCFAADGNT